MIRPVFFCACLLFSIKLSVLGQSLEADTHIVIMVCDGLRPESVTEEKMPTLARLARSGTTFTKHHSVYLSSTETNGTAIVTGCWPSVSGILANNEYRPDINTKKGLRLDDTEVMRKDDEITGGKHIARPTLAEIVQSHGGHSAASGTKPVIKLVDRNEDRKTPAAKASAIISAGKVHPPEVATIIESALGPFPKEVTFPNDAADSWTTRALVEGLWKEGVPPLSVLWMSDPDFTQHQDAPGAPQVMAALRSVDGNLATVLATLEAKGVRESTHIFVVSDHGFSSISAVIDTEKLLKDWGFSAAEQYLRDPRPGEIVIVNLGGASFFYVIGHDAEVIKRLVEKLQTWEHAGVIFTREARPGTFALSEAKLDSPHAPDVAISFKWSSQPGRHGLPGTVPCSLSKYALSGGMHASLSRYDMHNTLIAAGPGIRQGFVNLIPSGNADIAPTVLTLLGLPGADQMNGRVLTEALRVNEGSPLPSTTDAVLKPQTPAPDAAWSPYLKISRVGTAIYFDEGNNPAPAVADK